MTLFNTLKFIIIETLGTNIVLILTNKKKTKNLERTIQIDSKHHCML